MSTELIKAEKTQTLAPTESFGAFSSIQRFEDAQRMAKVLCASSIVPQSYRENIADCVIALEMSNRIGANPLAVMQNLYIVHGRPAWSSQFLISCINASGKFTPLRYAETGDRANDTWGCVAWASDRAGERLESPEVTLGMAKAEGWYQKNGSKWKTMPQLMLRYRAATLFARLFAPELTMGIQCDDEVIDITPVATEVKTVSPSKMFAERTATVVESIPAAAEPAKETASNTAQPSFADHLGSVISAAGFSFDEFSKWGKETGSFTDDLDGYAQINEAMAKSLLRSKAAIIADLKKLFPK